MKVNDAVFGLVLTTLGVTVLTVVQSYPKIPGQQVGPALFPGLIALGLSICGVILMIRGWLNRSKIAWFEAPKWFHSPRHRSGFGILMGGIIFYIAASNTIGFLPTAWLLLVALMLNLKVNLVRSTVLALLIALAVHFAFYKLLRVPLPWGWLAPIAW